MTSPPPTPRELLAKSPRGAQRLTLQQHLTDTEGAAARVFDLDRRWGHAFCRFFKVAGPERERFLLHVRIAALFHDLGKANEDFYDAVTNPARVVQTLRHEHLSALILHLPEVRAWLSTNPSLDLDVITAAVLSHHLKASLDGDYQWCAPRGKTAVRLHLQHPEVHAILRRIGAAAGLRGTPILPKASWVADAPPWSSALGDGRAAANRLRRDVKTNDARRSLLLATKAGVIVADSVASGLVRENHVIDTWIDDVAHGPALAADDILNAILRKREQQVAGPDGQFKYHTFQLRAAEQGPRALLLAACGAGKTLAAWKWAEEQARSHELGKVVFLYPTRGTATEGFRDYVSWAPETEAALVHGTSRYELEAMRENPSEGGRGKRFELSESEARLFALGLWSRRYFSATVDQFLSFMEHAYTSLCLLPLLADAAIIIDEVHSFDRHMFEILIGFLKSFDVPVLCMTATLPPDRRKDLEAAGLRVYPTAEDRGELQDLEEKEHRPRYRLEPVQNSQQAYGEAFNAYREGRRVLWVVNQVARCQELARQLRAEIGPTVLCYHSRFRLEDRRRMHDITVQSFQQKAHPAIAVTTQVCEMSLDLDADVLISEIAPATALVQRFGRAHRRLDRPTDFRARLLIYPPDDHLPYTKADIEAARTFLASFGPGDINQHDLAEALVRHAPAEPEAEGTGRFLTAGYFATPGAFRDADDFSSPCILDTDLPVAEALYRAKQPLDPLKVNVPRRAVPIGGKRPDWLPTYIGIAPAAQYDKDLGFCVD